MTNLEEGGKFFTFKDKSMPDPAVNSTPAKRIAAIDLGTNSFHAVLVDIYPDGSFRTIDKLKEMVILAEKGTGKQVECRCHATGAGSS